MPCCFAMIHYAQCGHGSLFKLGCTAHCEDDDICPVSDQRTLVITRSLWNCEDCRIYLGDAADDARAAAWAERARAIGEDPSEMEAEARAQLIDTLRSRELHEDNNHENARAVQVEETQWVAEWTLEYGRMLWDILYERSYGLRAARRRIKLLRSMRPWDMVVTRDALRGGKELRRQQVARSPWISARNQSSNRNSGQSSNRNSGQSSNRSSSQSSNQSSRDSQRKELPSLSVLNGPPPVLRAEDLESEPSEDEQAREEKQASEKKQARDEKQVRDEKQAGENQGLEDTGMEPSEEEQTGEEYELASRDESGDVIMTDRYSPPDFDPA
ncbi:hypothetical protein G7Z17_g5961 [Cylindrodendrum hubeiense]|uniref:Uncharacterized protein n=1 Tax=Cylindrodendrum hubeiense TaxID=595255 RepID=A0A9P5HBW7_9HYPO|nr:hypothetical protein G7Z17_g5961 [Cylindrodendrum hubeiense]